MTQPFAWLDILVATCAIGAVFAGLLTIAREPSPLRGKLKCTGTVCFGLALVLGASDHFLTLLLAPRLNFTGVIQSLINHGGKNPTCTIRITNSAGTSATLVGEFSCYGLQAADQASISWLAFNGRIARLDVLSGPDKGSFRNGGDPFTSLMSFGAGVFLLYAARKSLRTNPTAIPRKSGRDTPLDGDVDTKSMLNLNAPD